jgi:hypothetical protein
MSTQDCESSGSALFDVPGIVVLFKFRSVRMGTVMEEGQVPEPPLSGGEWRYLDQDDFLEFGNSDVQGRVRRRQKKRMFVAGGVGAAIVLVIALVVVGGAGPGSTNAAAQVMRSARTTLAAHTADLQISGSITGDGQSIPITGSGYADLSANLETMTVSFSAKNTSLQETEVQNGATVYLQLIENDQNIVSQVIPGKNWVQIPVATPTSGLGDGTPNILAQLQLLTAQGNTVTSLGSSTINGEAVKGYQVIITKKAMAAGLKREEALGGAEASAIKAALNEFSINPPQIDVWVNSSDLLQREKTVISVSTGSTTVGGEIDIDFSNYGTQTEVTIPAGSQVAPYSTFLSAAQAAG